MYKGCEGMRVTSCRCFKLAMKLALWFLCVLVGCVSPPAADPREADIYLIPVGPTRREMLEQLEEYYERTFKLQVQLTPALVVQEDAIDPVRRQLPSENITHLLEKSVRATSDNPRALLIGITPIDMYTLEIPEWRFAFATRRGTCCAIVSFARMNLERFSHSDPRLVARVRKLVTRSIAFQRHGLGANSDPRSVLYNRILSLSDLDFIDERTVERDVIEVIRAQHSQPSLRGD